MRAVPNGTRMGWRTFLWKASSKHGNTSLSLSRQIYKGEHKRGEDLLMFVALPFLIFYASFSLCSADARTGLLCLTGLPVHYCGWSAFITRFCLPERLPDALWGAIAGYGGFALIARTLSPAALSEGAWIWRRQVPCCLRGVALLGNTAVTEVFLAAMLTQWQVWRRATGER